MILLVVFLLLPLSNAEVEVENKKKGTVYDELTFTSSWKLMSDEEAKQSNEIIKNNRAKTYVIEILVMLDYSVYAWWLNLNKKDSGKTISDLNTFYAHIFKKIKKRYNLVAIGGVKLDLEVVDIIIAKSIGEVPFVENEYKVSKKEVNIDTVLRNLTTWLQKEKKRLPRYDLFAFFTKYDTGIYDGLAWPMAACTENGVSVTRELGFYDTYHAASHEIGHNLGSHHDNSSDCPYDNQYIMAAGVEFITDKNFKYRHTFSKCSLRYFEDYIRKMNKESLNCLVIQSAKKYINLDQLTKVPLGNLIDADRQCQILHGPKSFFCAGGSDDFKTMCRQMTCWNDTRQICERSPKAAPADRTPCASGKSCQEETCSPDRNVSSGQENCFYGDWKGYVLDEDSNEITCKTVGLEKSFLCYMPDIALSCCATCSKFYKPEKTGCEYGDKDRGCKKAECTYAKMQTCCRTCEANVSDTCQFGDKASWCKSLKPYQCYANEDTCCTTCKKLEDKTKKECRYGDKRDSCESDVKKQPIICKQTSIQNECCSSCKVSKTPQCVDWDPTYCSTIAGHECYIGDNQDNCCKKCQSLKKAGAPKGCEYGDKSPGCAAYHCKSSKDQCCYTCRNQ